MTLETQIRTQLTNDEGRVSHVYEDNLGYATIGIGRMIDRRKGGRLRDEEIDMLFANDLREKMVELDKYLPWWRQIDEPRAGVMLNMAFQMGCKGLAGFPLMLTAVKLGRWAEAAEEMLDSLWAKQTPDRAKRLSRQMREGVWVFEDGTPI